MEDLSIVTSPCHHGRDAVNNPRYAHAFGYACMHQGSEEGASRRLNEGRPSAKRGLLRSFQSVNKGPFARVEVDDQSIQSSLVEPVAYVDLT